MIARRSDQPAAPPDADTDPTPLAHAPTPTEGRNASALEPCVEPFAVDVGDNDEEITLPRFVAEADRAEFLRVARRGGESEMRDLAPDAFLAEWFTNLDRSWKRPSGPVANRPNSDGARFAHYSAFASPAPAHTERVRPAKVLLDRSVEVPTVIISSRFGTRPLRRVALALSVGLVAGVVGLLLSSYSRSPRLAAEGDRNAPGLVAIPAAAVAPLPSPAGCAACAAPMLPSASEPDQPRPDENSAVRPTGTVTATARPDLIPAKSRPSTPTLKARERSDLDVVERY